MTWVSNFGRFSADFPNFSFLKLDCSQLRASFDDPMGVNESARQAGSNDTIPDPWLTTDGFAVGMLDAYLIELSAYQVLTILESL